MKKSLLIFSILAIFAVTRCKGGNSGGGSSGGGDSEPDVIINEVNQAIENSKNYHGSMTVSSQMLTGSDLENEKTTFNAETKEYAEDTGGTMYVCVPEENPDNDPAKENLSKLYSVDKDTPADSYYAITSQSYADYQSSGMFDNEMVYQSILAFSVASETKLHGGKDYFKTFMVYEMNDGMLEGMGMHIDEEEATTSYETSVKEDGTKTASYIILGTGKAMNGDEYPKMDVDYSFTMEYDDKVTLIKQLVKMTYIMAPEMKMEQSMVMTVNVGYEFDAAFYATAKAQTTSVTKPYGFDGGYFKNRLDYHINGVSIGSYDDFTPNEEVTVEKVISRAKTHRSLLSDMNIEGVFIDEACTVPFAEKKSTVYDEAVYIKATPKAGKASMIVTTVINRLKGTLPFNDEEFEFYKKMISPEEDKQEIYISTVEYGFNVNGALMSDDRYALQSMTLNGEPFTANTISKEYLAEHQENVMTLNYDYLREKERPLNLSNRIISNDSNGLLFLGTNNTSTGYFVLNTADVAKANPTFAVKAYQSNKLLAKGEALPDDAVLLDSSAITIKYTVADSETEITALPDDYAGEFTIVAELKAPTAFVYLVIE